MYGYIYITENLINNKKYIGKHKAKKFSLTYKGSGRLLLKAFNLYGKDNFKCSILTSDGKVPTICNSLEELDFAEKYYIKLYDCVKSPEYYNLADGGTGGDTFSNHSEDIKHKIKEKMSLSHKIRWKNISEEELAIRKQRLSIANKGQISNTKGKHWYNNGIEEKLLFNSEASTYLENGWVKGGLKNKFSPEINRKRSEAIRNYYLKNPEKRKEKGEKISRSKKGNVIITDSQKNQISQTLKQYYLTHDVAIKGKHLSQESKSKISKNNKGRIAVYKGDESLKILPEQLPEYLSAGWTKGRGKVNRLKSNKGKVWITNMTENKMISIKELDYYLNQGWKKGLNRKD